ncbi:MAG: ATP-binding cassette domain-containing protein [Bacillota bacterium]|nr:ATP-binding cassette domain-containing protein [Bacillota bacterium]
MKVFLERWLVPLILLVAIAVPPFLSLYPLGVIIGILTFAILGLGLNIVVGYAGLLDLGYAAFFAIGAYTTALLMVKAEASFWAALPVALFLAGVAGVLLGYPVLRLRSDYLAIVTLGFGEIVRITVTNLDFTGGPEGILGIPRPSLFGFRLDSDLSMYYLALALVLIALYFSRQLAFSRLGRAWLSLREDELAAEPVGVPVLRVKLMAFVMGAIWGGLAGAFFAVRVGVINPTSFVFMQSVLVLMVVVIGGMGSLPGVLLGAAAVVGLPELLRSLQDWRFLIFGIALIAMMLLLPEGLWPAPRRRPHPALFAAALEEAPRQWERIQRELKGRPQETGKPLLVVEDLAHRFGGLKAVQGVDFVVPEGQIVSMIGPNGAGKTTVFNTLSGVLKPQEGHILFAGQDIKGLRPHRVAHLGMTRTFQGIRLFGSLEAYENVLLGLYPRQKARVIESLLHTPAQQQEERESLKEALAWLHFVGLGDKAGYLARELSYGDQRRLELARALAARPRLLLLDEPAAGMNPAEKEGFLTLLEKIRELGITVFLIEHDMSLVMGVSDQVLVLDQGRLIAQGTPAQVQADPRVIDAYLGREEEAATPRGV